MVRVAADHGHTSQFVPTDANRPGLVSTLLAAAGALVQANDGTDGNRQEISQTRTGSQVRVAGPGPSSEAIHGALNQTDLFGVMADALGPDAPKPGPVVVAPGLAPTADPAVPLATSAP